MVEALVDLCRSFVRNVDGSPLANDNVLDFLAMTLAKAIYLSGSNDPYHHHTALERAKFLTFIGGKDSVAFERIIKELSATPLQSDTVVLPVSKPTISATRGVVSEDIVKLDKLGASPLAMGSAKVKQPKDAKAIKSLVSTRQKLMAKKIERTVISAEVEAAETRLASLIRKAHSVSAKVDELKTFAAEVDSSETAFIDKVDTDFWGTLSESMYFHGIESTSSGLQKTVSESPYFKKHCQRDEPFEPIFFVQCLFAELQSRGEVFQDTFDSWFAAAYRSSQIEEFEVLLLNKEIAEASIDRVKLLIDAAKESKTAHLLRLEAQVAEYGNNLDGLNSQIADAKLNLRELGNRLQTANAKVDSLHTEYVVLADAVVDSILPGKTLNAVREAGNAFRENFEAHVNLQMSDDFIEELLPHGPEMELFITLAYVFINLKSERFDFCPNCTKTHWGCTCNNSMNNMVKYLSAQHQISMESLGALLAQNAQWAWSMFHLNTTREMQNVIVSAFKRDVRNFDQIIWAIRVAPLVRFFWNQDATLRGLDASHFSHLVEGHTFEALVLLANGASADVKSLPLSAFKSLMEEATNSGEPPSKYAIKHWASTYRAYARAQILGPNEDLGRAVPPGSEYDD